jgi:hypothetical protein
MDPIRPYKIITGVVREALRSSGRSGVVLSGGGPEETLLGEWLEEAKIPFVIPRKSDTGQTKGLLNSICHQAGRAGVLAERGSELAAEASGLAGWANAWAEGLLLLGTSNKTCLLLSPTQPIQPVLPLGDLYASQVVELAGGSTFPPCLQNASHEELRAVDRALEAYYERGFREEAAFEGLDSGLRRSTLAALANARRGWHPKPLIPKLGEATLGLDLDP